MSKGGSHVEEYTSKTDLSPPPVGAVAPWSLPLHPPAAEQLLRINLGLETHPHGPFKFSLGNSGQSLKQWHKKDPATAGHSTQSRHKKETQGTDCVTFP